MRAVWIKACLIAWVLAGCSEPGPAEISAGAGTVLISDLTPNDDYLEVNALVLKAGDEYLGFCSVDALAVGTRLMEAVGQRLGESGSSIGLKNLMISASHSHSGGFHNIQDGITEELVYGEFSQEALDRAADQVASAVLEAEGSLQPARLVFGEGEAPGYNYNRAFFDGFADPQMAVMVAESLQGEPIAWLINYAAHPTILYAEDALRPGRDFPGGLAQRLREASGADVPVLFVNAAAGNVAPNPPEAATYTEQALLMGRGLAEVVIGIRSNGETRSVAKLRSKRRSIVLPPAICGPVLPGTTTVAEFRVDDTVFLSLPGEACSQTGRLLRQFAVERGADHVFLCGYTNDYLGYHPDESEYHQCSYESMMCFYGPQMTCWYVEALFPSAGDLPWCCSPMLLTYRESYEKGLSRGEADREVIAGKWRAQMELLDTDVDIVGLQLRAFTARLDFKELEDEKRAFLIGIAEGSGQPYDVVVLLEYAGEVHYL